MNKCASDWPTRKKIILVSSIDFSQRSSSDFYKFYSSLTPQNHWEINNYDVIPRLPKQNPVYMKVYLRTCPLFYFIDNDTQKNAFGFVWWMSDWSPWVFFFCKESVARIWYCNQILILNRLNLFPCIWLAILTTWFDTWLTQIYFSTEW